jgi:5-methylcytosine-specific restriction endonuclease McrA
MAYKEIEKQKKYHREWRAKRRIVERDGTFEKLGGKCVVCNNNDYRVLEIDHVKAIRRKPNDGSAESGTRLRQRIHNGSRTISNLQLLCANCHTIKTYEELWGISANSRT